MSRGSSRSSHWREAQYASPEPTPIRRNRQSVPPDVFGLGNSILTQREARMRENAHMNLPLRRGKSRERSSRQASSSSRRSRSPRRSQSPLFMKTEENDTQAMSQLVPYPAFGGNPRIPEENLDDKQKVVLDLAVRQRKNICVIGQAGTGKSTLIKTLVENFYDIGLRARVVAPSGTAALNVNGCTIHHFGGLGRQQNKGIAQYEAMPPFVREKLRSTQVLIVDEISMVPNELFERLNRMLRKAHRSEAAFGGIQIIVVGDFCQLSPVKPFEYCFECGHARSGNNTGVYTCPVHGSVYQRDQWAFRAPCWDLIGFSYVLLNHVHRQTEEQLLRLLNKQWRGVPFNRQEIDLLENHECEVDNAVHLYSLNSQRQERNNDCFKALAGKKHTYLCKDRFEHQHQLHPELYYLGQPCQGNPHTLTYLSQHNYEEHVELKLGMPVILLYNLNIDQGLANGSQGIIVGFRRYSERDIPRSSYRDPHDDEQQLSRWAALRLQCIKDFMTRNATRDRYGDVYPETIPPLPIVKFNNRSKPVTIWPDPSVSERGFTQPHSLLIRTQIPLVAGWALTIHKSQGMTLDKVVVDVSKSFEFGQAYVALSRARTLRGLKVEGWGASANNLAISDEVKDFLELHFGLELE